MTDLTPGKRYRFTVSGTASGLGHLDLGEGYALPSPLIKNDVGTVELLPDPLPTTPGSVIEWCDPSDDPHRQPVRTLVLAQGHSEHANWMDIADPDGGWYRPEDITGATVLFDAGAK